MMIRIPNPGTILVGFEMEMNSNEQAILQVSMIPGSPITDGGFKKSLDEW